MAEPPEEPPGGLSGEPPEEPPDDRLHEPPREPSGSLFDEPPDAEGSLDEPTGEPLEEPTGEPLEEPPGEPLEESPDRPTGGPFEESPDRPTGGPFEEPPDDRLHEPPRRPNGSFFDEPPDGEGSLDEPTGELFDDLAVEPPGDLLGDLGEEVHSPTELAERRAQERAQRRRAGQQRLLVLVLGLVVVIVVIVLVTRGGGGSSVPPPVKPVSDAAKQGSGLTYLSSGLANAGLLTANILIADRNNNRLLVISSKGQTVWQTSVSAPGDAYFSSTGRSVVVTQHLKAVVVIRGVDSNRVDYSYGHANTPGSGDDRLNDPQTGHLTATGQIVIADLGNCRIVFATKTSHKPALTLGNGQCVHKPATSFAQPDAVFPTTTDGGLVVTERSPAWIDILSKANVVTSKIRLTGFAAPSDAHEFAPGRLIVTDQTHPGTIEELSVSSGKPTWTYAVKSGNGELDRPTLAVVLAGGDVLVADSLNDRVIVIDPKTNAIVWQYGHTGKPGSQPGFLHTPDSIDLVP
jgi:hypothetical protein